MYTNHGVTIGGDKGTKDFGTIEDGATAELIVKTTNCKSLTGSIDKGDKDGWRGGGTGKSINFTFDSTKVDSGKHPGEFGGSVKGCPGGDGKNTWSVSADVNVVGLRLKKLSYSGNQMHVIHEDSLDNDKDYTAPHWKDKDDDGDASDKGERRFPVAFTRNTSMKVSAEFWVEPADVVSSVTVKGKANNGMGTIEETVQVDGNVIEITKEKFPNKLPNKIDFFNTLDIEWEISFDGGNTFLPAGKSKNRIYVTLKDPILSNGNTFNSEKLFETVIDIGCRNARGKSSDTKAVRAIWSDFKNRPVTRKKEDGFNNTDDTEMSYWKFARVCTSMEVMLADPNGSGSCGAWAELYHNVIRAQGIKGSDVYKITPDTSVNSGATRFLVKNWGFGKHIGPGDNDVCETTAANNDVQVTPDGKTPGSGVPCVSPGDNGVLDTTNPAKDDVKEDGIFENASYKYILESGTLQSNGRIYGHKLGDVSNQKGIPGQNNPEPPEFFQYHWIVKFDGKFYDPSYGIGGCDSKKKYENKAISGFKSIVNEFDVAKKNRSKKELLFKLLTK